MFDFLEICNLNKTFTILSAMSSFPGFPCLLSLLSLLSFPFKGQRLLFHLSSSSSCFSRFESLDTYTFSLPPLFYFSSFHRSSHYSSTSAELWAALHSSWVQSCLLVGICWRWRHLRDTSGFLYGLETTVPRWHGIGPRRSWLRHKARGRRALHDRFWSLIVVILIIVNVTCLFKGYLLL